MIWFPARTRRILEKTADGRLKKAQAAQILSVSRKTIYKWLNRYIQLPTISRDKLTKEILAVVIANPSLGPKKIALILQKSFNNVSSGRIWQLLKENSLNTAKLRQDYATNYRLPTQAVDPDRPRHLRLNSYTRKRMVEAVILGGAKVNQTVGDYHISHKTFFKWKKRYFEAQNKDLTILPAMADQNPIGAEHPRGVDENTKQAVLSLVATVPNLSSHQISRYLGIIGNHGVQRVLERANLSRLTDRIRFAAEQKTLAKPSFPPTEERAMLDGKEFIPNLAPVPPPISGAFRLSFRSVAITLSLLVIFSGILISWIRMLLGAGSSSQAMGLILATIALIVGTFFFLYSLKYYITLAIILSFSQQSLEVKQEEVETKRKGFLSWFLGITSRRSFAGKKRKPVGLEPNLDHVTLRRYPVISVHIPFYNEKNVVERAIAANTNFDYPEYEVILADDSKDSTTDIILNYLKKYGTPKITEGDGFTLAEVTIKPGVVLKHLHRTSRAGFKGAALKLALQYTNPKAEFISIFDADFVPYPDTLTLFLKYFKEHNNLSEDYESTNVAAVQGYQWHVLNKSENWITRGVRTEYAGSYVIERSGTELYGGLKMIAGSVYMIRRRVLEDIGWGVSITEDYELTLKLYEKGYKVVYTPYIQGPAECVSTLKRLIRQRMRWAEGHSFNTKIMFLRLLLNRNLTRAEKLEFLYLIPYYLQAFLFMVGTIAWLVSETILRAKLPFWTSLWGWSLVLTNLIALPLVNIVGLFLEESEEKDYMGILSFVVLSYLVVPFQAYAALKGFLEKEEGNWFRTPKTGRITDVFSRGRFYRLISGIFTKGKLTPTSSLSFENVIPSSYLALTSANSRFDGFRIRPKRFRFIGRSVVAVVLILTILLNAVSFGQNNSYPPNLNSNKLTFDGTKEFPIEGRDSFAQTETPQFHLKIPDNQPKKTSWLEKLFKNEVQAAEPEVKTSLFDSSGVFVEGINTKVSKEESGYKLSLVDNIGLKPGKYTLKAKWSGEDGKTYESSQDFRWGVLAVNTNKSMYTSGEVIKFEFGVLDDRGATICDAQLVLDVTDPSGEKTTLSSQNGLIKQNEKCTSKGTTEGPDYSGELPVDKLGSYNLHLVADTQNGQRSIDDTVEVKDIKDIPFDIERTDFPSRIYPPSPYPVVITIKANQDFQGVISDQVPASFEISQSNDLQVLQMTDTTTQGIKKLINWNMNLKKGETYKLGYTIKFPRTSPEFYLIGPLRLTEGQALFSEARSWQIAGDVVTTKFMESGTDATQGFEFYSSTSGSPTSSADVSITGPKVIKFDSGAGAAQVYALKSGVLADAGRRISFYINFASFHTTGTEIFLALVVAVGNNVYLLGVDQSSAPVLKLFDAVGTLLATGTTPLSTNTTYRIAFSYTLTTTSNHHEKVYINGNIELDNTAGTLANSGTAAAAVGYVGALGGSQEANRIVYIDNVYIDDGTDLTDPGNIEVTAKLPNADTNRGWDNITGSGTGNCLDNSTEYGCVDDRPLNTALNMRDSTNDAGDEIENFAIQNAATGDENINGNTLVARTAWVWTERAGSSGTLAATMYNNGSTVGITLTTTPSLFTNIVDSTTYPTDTQAVGMTAGSSTADTYMYETGMLIAFVGAAVPEAALLATPLALFIPKIIKSWQQGTLMVDFKELLGRLWKEVQKLLTKSGVNRKHTDNIKRRKRKRRKRKVDK